LFAKNSDRPHDETQVVERHPRRAAGGSLRTTHLEIEDTGAHALIGSRLGWMWGFEHGVNEHGVAIGNERIFTVADPRGAPPGLTGMDLVRLGLERATSADAALDTMTGLLERHGQGGSGAERGNDPYWSSFIVADRHGAWVLETSDREWVAQPVAGGAAISNRVTLATGWTRGSAGIAIGTDWSTRLDPNVPTEPSDVRLAVTGSCAAGDAARTSPADIVAALRDHGSGTWGRPGDDPADVAPPPPPGAPGWDGFTVCWHIRTVESTMSSMIVELPEDVDLPLRHWIALGSPCVSVYVPGFGMDSVPPALADAATWRRFVRLRDRVEADGDTLAAVRAELGPLENDLWEQAERVAGDPASWSAYSEAAWASVDAALIRLGV
jgi:secernin